MHQILLTNPKIAHNVGAAIRASSCFGGGDVYFTGDRLDIEGMKRLPREERMKGYADSPWVNLGSPTRPIDQILNGVAAGTGIHLTPVAVEIHPGSTPLPMFEHPAHALYVFGPEDGSLDDGIRRNCHYFVEIPAAHCLNLAAAVNLVLSHRHWQRAERGLEPWLSVADSESRGWHTSAMEEGAYT